MADENIVQGSQKKSPKPIVITLDGNIGAGKSTLLEEVRQACPEFEVCTEPVGEWMTIQDENGKSLVELFYEDKMRWAYTFQNLTILTRLKAIRDVLRTTKKKVVIMERSVLTDRYVFAELMKDDGAIDQLEYQLYLKWFDQFATELPLKGMIHVTTDVKLASTRIAKRGAKGKIISPQNTWRPLTSSTRNGCPTLTYRCCNSARMITWIPKRTFRRSATGSTKPTLMTKQFLRSV